MIWLLIPLVFDAVVSGIPDWLDAELLIVFAMAGAGIYTMISEGRAHRREADERIAIAERLARIETMLGPDAAHTIVERVSELEGKIEILADIVGAMPGTLERVATLEARADFKPWGPTRRKGKFAKQEPVSPPPEET